MKYYSLQYIPLEGIKIKGNAKNSHIAELFINLC